MMTHAATNALAMQNVKWESGHIEMLGRISLHGIHIAPDLSRKS
jgi:hypothetical protein